MICARQSRPCPHGHSHLYFKMAAGTYDGHRELRSRLPDVSDSIIAYFLSKYNVEECYEKLKNGVDETMDVSDFNDSLLAESSVGTNMHHLDTVDAPWPLVHHPQDRHPHLHPYPATSSHQGNTTDSELLCDQKLQVEYMYKIKDSYLYNVSALRSEADQKRQTLTALRIQATEGPTKLDIANLQDIVTTLEYDIQTLQNKIQVEKTQAEMKKKLDVYTEEGVRWNCHSCDFLNHPLMSRCESCDQTK